MVHDLERPDTILYRSPKPIITPETEESAKASSTMSSFRPDSIRAPISATHVRRLLRHERLRHRRSEDAPRSLK